jgi:hypothetical protein
LFVADSSKADKAFSDAKNNTIENTTYNILAALGRDADFLYDTIGTYIKDAQNVLSDLNVIRAAIYYNLV